MTHYPIRYYIALGICLSALLPGPFSHAKEAKAAAADGKVAVDVTDVLGHNLPSKVELRAPGLAAPICIRAPKGQAEQACPAGDYRAYITVYDNGFPSVVDILEVNVKAGDTAYVLVNLVEAAGKPGALRAFDQDGDLFLDRVELQDGSDPYNPCFFPGADPVPLDEQRISDKPGWYRGELHAFSSFGGGAESVADLIKRAESAGLDFLAITDRNTMASAFDAGFKSKSVVLLPAIEWGDDKHGLALIYGPRTRPEPPGLVADAQGLVQRVQAQGGIFAIAHPCFPTAPWQWGLSYVNAIEVWCRDWSAVPPIAMKDLGPAYQERREGKPVFSISRAAETPRLSANGQAALFLDFETLRGLQASVVGGSCTASPSVAIAEPITYVFATEKSLLGILEGLRRGHTFVSSGPKGPKAFFTGDVKKDGKIEALAGGVIPLKVPTRLQLQVIGAKGLKAQILCNGLPIMTKKIESDDFAIGVTEEPTSYSVYRARVIGAESPGQAFGFVRTFAMTSPIYAQDLPTASPVENPEEDYVDLDKEGTPAVNAIKKVEDGGRIWVKTDKGGPLPPPGEPEEFIPPEGAKVREIKAERWGEKKE